MPSAARAAPRRLSAAARALYRSGRRVRKCSCSPSTTSMPRSSPPRPRAPLSASDNPRAHAQSLPHLSAARSRRGKDRAQDAVFEPRDRAGRVGGLSDSRERGGHRRFPRARPRAAAQATSSITTRRSSFTPRARPRRGWRACSRKKIRRSRRRERNEYAAVIRAG